MRMIMNQLTPLEHVEAQEWFDAVAMSFDLASLAPVESTDFHETVWEQAMCARRTAAHGWMTKINGSYF